MAKSLRDRILEALKKEGLTIFELSERLGMKSHYILWKLEEEGLNIILQQISGILRGGEKDGSITLI